MISEFTSERTLSAASFSSVADLWNHRVGSTPTNDALVSRQPSGWQTLNWRQLDERVREKANGLLAMGVEPGDRVAILARTRVEWVLADLAIQNIGGVTTAIYPTSPPEDCRWILDHSEARFVFAEDAEQVAKLLAIRSELSIERVVLIEGRSPDAEWIMPLSDLIEDGRAYEVDNPEAYRDANRAIEPDDLASLIYTSGTTGLPKGVRLTHDNWIYEAEALDLLGILSPADRQLLFLPLAHVFAKVMVVAFIRLGIPTIIEGDSDRLREALQTQQPTFMAGVPRIFEKAQSAIRSDLESGNFVRRKTFDWAVSIGRQLAEAHRNDRRVGPRLRMKAMVADRLVYRRVRERFGGRLRFFVSGGAPLPSDTAAFFHHLGVLILEGWGLTETTAATTVNLPDDFRFGTVGKAMPGTDLRIAEDGEILVRSRGVMEGYHLDQASTDETIIDGWLRTGDIGTLLPSGHLKITDRKKNILVTAGGKNVAPARFQNQLVALTPLVSHVLLLGDRRPFCTALIALDPDELARQGLTVTTAEARIASAVETVNRTLPGFERARRFAILPEDLSEANGLLTPSLKVKRSAVERRYQSLVDQLYASTEPR